MATTYEVIFLGTLPRIDPTQDNEVAENAAALQGSYGTSSAPLSSNIRTLSANDLSEDDDDTYDTDNDGGYDSFRINGGAAQNFDATATYNAILTYADGTTANITATVFQDVNGNTYLVPETTANADQAALTALPIQSLQLVSVVSASGDGMGDRVAGDFKSSVDGTAGADAMNVGYTDAQGDQITTGADAISAGAGNDTISSGSGNDSIYAADGNDEAYGGDGGDQFFGGAGDDRFGDWSTDGGNDTVFGGDGSDMLIGAGDNDVVHGDAGDDALSGGAGADSVYGGAGSDWFMLSQDHQLDSLYGGEDLGDRDILGFGNWQTVVGVTVIYTGNEAGTYDYNGVGDASGIFTGIEGVSGTESTDIVDASATTSANDISGNGGSDTLTGGSAGDTLWGGNGMDRLSGGGGADRLDGGTGNDSLLGDDGNDTLWGGGGADTLNSGLGNDTVFGGAGNDVVTVSDDHGTDLIDAGADYDQLVFATPTSALGVTVIQSGNGAGIYDFDGTSGTGSFTGVEQFSGTQHADTFDASATTTGTTFYSLGGADSLVGGTGTDRLYGGDGADLLVGGGGADTIEGDTGDDGVQAGAGNDSVTAGAGSDLVSGDDGDDILIGNAGDDTLYGGTGNDLLVMGSAGGTYQGGDDPSGNINFGDGGAGSDTLIGSEAADGLYGGDDADRLLGKAGDTVVGGEGGTDADVLVLDLTSVESITYGGGDDEAGIVTFTAASGGGTLIFSEIEEIRSIVAVDGTSGADALAQGYADAEGDQIDGSDGLNDLIYASDGADEVDAGGGADTVYGGEGDDTLFGDDLDDIGADVVYGGAGNDELVGNALSDTLYGGDGDDYIYGGYFGQAGGDSLDGGDGIDTVDYSFSDAGITLELAAGTGGGGDAAGDTLQGFEVVFGSAYDDLISGGAGSETLEGRDGADTLQGGAGDDVLTGGAGTDLFGLATGGGADRITDFDLADDDQDGLTNDQLDVSDLVNPDGSAVRVFDITVTDDGFGNAVLNFAGGETFTLQGVGPAQAQAPGQLHAMGIPCFTPGMRIETDCGPVAVERLRPGDRVRTLDHGWQPVRWVGCRKLGAADLAAFPRLRPVVIRKGAIGNARRLRVSPQHGFLLGGQLVRAKHLAQRLGGKAARVDQRAQGVTYIHFLCDRHEIVFADGTPTETLFPGPQALRSLGFSALSEVLTLFPDLAADLFRRNPAAPAYGHPARAYWKPSAATGRGGDPCAAPPVRLPDRAPQSLAFLPGRSPDPACLRRE